MSRSTKIKRKYVPFKVDDKTSPYVEKLKHFLSYHDSFGQLDAILKDVQKKNEEWEEAHPKDVNQSPYRYYGASKPSFEVAVYALERLGFVKLSDNETVRFRSYRSSRDDDTTDVFQIWAHPSGVLLDINTCGQERGFRRVNAIHARMSVDMGMGFNMSYPLSRTSSYSSSGFSHLSGGRSSHDISFSSDNIFNVIDFLREHQMSGPVLPFNQWPEGLYPGSINLDEVLNWEDFPSYPSTDAQENERVARCFIEKTEALCQTDQVTSIPGLSDILQEVLTSSLRYGGEPYLKTQTVKDYLSQFSERFSKRMPLPADLFAEYVDKMTTYHLDRYPSEKEAQVVDMCLSALKNGHLPTLEQMEEVTPHGSSWLLASLCQAAQGQRRYIEADDEKAKVCVDLLFNTLESIPFASLKKQVEEPDSTGMTFFTHMANIMYAPWITASPGSRFVFLHAEKIIRTVAQRYRNESLDLPLIGNDQHTLRGVWFRNHVSYKDHQNPIKPPFGLLTELEQMFENAGFLVSREWNLIFPCAVDEEKRNMSYKVPCPIHAKTTHDFVDRLPEDVISDPALFKELLMHHVEEFMEDKPKANLRKM